MKRGVAYPVACVLLLFFLAAPVGSQTIAEVVFLPQTFYVGDMVEARVVVRTTETLTLTVPDTLPSTENITIHSVTIVQRADGFEARIVFQPFFVGTQQLPVIGLGPVELSGVNVFVDSMVDASVAEPSPVRGQLMLPGTRFMIATIVASLLIVPLLILGAGKGLRRSLYRIVALWRENRPYRRLMKNLRTLQVEMHQLDGKRYYIRLLDEARVFFDRHYDVSILSATTGELEERLKRADAPDEVRETVVAMFRFGDQVKFAQRTVTLDDRIMHMEQLRELARTVFLEKKR